MSLLGARLAGPRVTLEAAAEGDYRILRTLDGQELGTVAVEEAEGALIIRSLCIDSTHRGYGAGSGAAALIREAWAANERWSALRAHAPAGAGLAVYYWMRMGLRPVAGKGPQDGLLLERRR